MAGNKGLLNGGVGMGVGIMAIWALPDRRVGGGVLRMRPGHVLREGLVWRSRGSGVRMVGGEVCVIDDVGEGNRDERGRG